MPLRSKVLLKKIDEFLENIYSVHDLIIICPSQKVWKLGRLEPLGRMQQDLRRRNQGKNQVTFLILPLPTIIIDITLATRECTAPKAGGDDREPCGLCKGENNQHESCNDVSASTILQG